jgi:hypothetical protein
MIFYVYFDPYGKPRRTVSVVELEREYGGSTEAFLRAAASAGAGSPADHAVGHVGTLAFADEGQLKEYLDGLGEEVEGFYQGRADSRPYNF